MKNPPSTLEEVCASLERGDIGVAEAFKILGEIECHSMPLSAQPINGKAEINKNRLDDALAEMNSLIGLKEVKSIIQELIAFIDIQKQRSRAGLLSESTTLHTIMKGNPGTGKTTVARIMGNILRELGVLPKGHLIEVERADLVGEYIGHTAQKTREQIKRSMGGILFIDEAYSLARGGERDFGKEAIDTLVKAMEDQKDGFVLILAGYRDEMEFFLRTNPGLRSRFPIHIEFPDYTIDELCKIAVLMLEKRQYILSKEARGFLDSIIQRKITTEIVPGNARMVRNVIEKAIRLQALRLVGKTDHTRDDLMLITVEELKGVT